ncbi:MAG TPA: 50S ribosomal protein L10 [Gemmataceae bacterium]|nr:50S ribosomal protein L10 [Gemmataceae bacterium]
MSKKIKQMQMDDLAKTFHGVKDLVLLSVSGVDSQTENKVRLDLRKKNIRLHGVKNSLARRVFGQMGIKIEGVWEGPTTLAWGANSIAELSRSVEQAFLKNDKLKDKVKVKTAVAEGELVPFAKALTMPTRQEAIGNVLAAILGPAASLASQLTGPASQLASQLKTISEKPAEVAAAEKPAEEPAAAAAAPPA